jgi:hypothetical protein
MQTPNSHQLLGLFAILGISGLQMGVYLPFEMLKLHGIQVVVAELPKH